MQFKIKNLVIFMFSFMVFISVAKDALTLLVMEFSPVWTNHPNLCFHSRWRQYEPKLGKVSCTHNKDEQ